MTTEAENKVPAMLEATVTVLSLASLWLEPTSPSKQEANQQPSEPPGLRGVTISTDNGRRHTTRAGMWRSYKSTSRVLRKAPFEPSH